MLCAVLADVIHRLIQPIHHLQAQNQRIPLLIEVLRPGKLDNSISGFLPLPVYGEGAGGWGLWIDTDRNTRYAPLFRSFSIAQRTIWARLLKLSLARILAMCFSTVRLLTTN